ncbi:MAG: heparinase II/III family protein [Clostridia bacterium]|nr:heparinase II/III family protein [Clostridia bacterium]
MFEQYYGKAKELMIPKEECRLFPGIDDRAVWENLHPQQKEFYLREAEKHLNYDWPTISATLYMDYSRTGERWNHTNQESKRRAVLLCLVLAECIENKGRFLDDIINGIWVVCEETSWVGPAHNGMFPKGGRPSALPFWRDEDIWVDHFAGDTGCLMAAVLSFLEHRLDAVAPQITERLRYELMRRIVLPCVNHNNFHWMVNGDGGKLNNWSPWCAGNCLAVTAVVCDDDDIRAAVFEKTLRIQEGYFRGLPEDGSCDEGARYWSIACNGFFEGLDVMEKLTGGKVNVYDNETLRRYAHFGVTQHIAQNMFTMYADNDRSVRIGLQGLWQIARKVGDDELRRLAVNLRSPNYEQHANDNQLLPCCMHQHAYATLTSILCYNAYAQQPYEDAPLLRDTWQPGVKIMTARQQEGSTEGLFLSARGGSNYESHNHNDVGSFIVYSDGQPAVIDLGAGVYTATSFGAKRYVEHLQTSSVWHNVLMAGGVVQEAGPAYRSAEEEYSCEEELSTLTVRAEKAYPESSPFALWKRSFALDRAEEAVTVADEFELKQPAAVEFILMTAVKPEKTETGLRIPVAGGRDVLAEWDMPVAVETEHLTFPGDFMFEEDWNGEAWRTVLKKDCSGQETFTVTFKQADC